jgi:hypothetical protein
MQVSLVLRMVKMVVKAVAILLKPFGTMTP